MEVIEWPDPPPPADSNPTYSTTTSGILSTSAASITTSSVLSNAASSDTTDVSSLSSASLSNPLSSLSTDVTSTSGAAEPKKDVSNTKKKGGKAVRRIRVEWSRFSSAVAKLEAQLPTFQALDGKKDKDQRATLKTTVADAILADTLLRAEFEKEGISDGDIREAVGVWFKNHLTPKEVSAGAVKPRKNCVNPLWKLMTARRVAPMRLWVSNNPLQVLEKALATDIGARSKASAELWRALKVEERAIWEMRAEEHNKDQKNQCFFNQHLLMEVLGDFLGSSIGFGTKQMGMCAFVIKGVFRAENGSLFYEELSVRLNEDCPAFAKWNRGYTERDKERWASWAEEAAAFVEALNPQQAQPQAPIGKHPGADRLQRTVDGRALLPEYQSSDEKNVVQILQALILCAWKEAQCPGDVDWPAITLCPHNYISERWLVVVVTPFSLLSVPEAFTIWNTIFKSQQQGQPFRFKPTPGSRKTSVSVKSTPVKGPAQKHKTPIPINLAFDDTGSLDQSQANSPITPIKQARLHQLAQPSLSDIVEEPENMNGQKEGLQDSPATGVAPSEPAHHNQDIATVTSDKLIKSNVVPGTCDRNLPGMRHLSPLSLEGLGASFPLYSPVLRGGRDLQQTLSYTPQFHPTWLADTSEGCAATASSHLANGTNGANGMNTNMIEGATPATTTGWSHPANGTNDANTNMIEGATPATTAGWSHPANTIGVANLTGGEQSTLAAQYVWPNAEHITSTHSYSDPTIHMMHDWLVGGNSPAYGGFMLNFAQAWPTVAPGGSNNGYTHMTPHLWSHVACTNSLDQALPNIPTGTVTFPSSSQATAVSLSYAPPSKMQDSTTSTGTLISNSKPQDSTTATGAPVLNPQPQDSATGADAPVSNPQLPLQEVSATLKRKSREKGGQASRQSARISAAKAASQSTGARATVDVSSSREDHHQAEWPAKRARKKSDLKTKPVEDTSHREDMGAEPEDVEEEEDKDDD